jgi:hypothetical protein
VGGRDLCPGRRRIQPRKGRGGGRKEKGGADRWGRHVSGSRKKKEEEWAGGPLRAGLIGRQAGWAKR